jgi:hypothetical protein
MGKLCIWGEKNPSSEKDRFPFLNIALKKGHFDGECA